MYLEKKDFVRYKKIYFRSSIFVMLTHADFFDADKKLIVTWPVALEPIGIVAVKFIGIFMTCPLPLINKWKFVRKFEREKTNSYF